MKAYFYARDAEYLHYEVDITMCIRQRGSINITFLGKEDYDPIQGRLALQSVKGDQTAIGFWSKPGKKEEIKAKVSGQLINFRGKKVSFEGSWEDPGHVVWDFEIDAEAT